MSKNIKKNKIKNIKSHNNKNKTQLNNNIKLSSEDQKKIKEAFDLFDFDSTGKIDPSLVRKAMDDMNYKELNPTIYKIILNLDTPQNEKKGINYNEFLQSFNEILGDQTSKDGVQRIFKEFTFESNSDTITPEILKSISEKIGDKLSDEEINIIIESASSNGKDISFEDFYRVIQNEHL